jgi:hypothetical protein
LIIPLNRLFGNVCLPMASALPLATKDFGTSRCGFLAMLHYLSLCAEGRHRGPQSRTDFGFRRKSGRAADITAMTEFDPTGHSEAFTRLAYGSR